MADRVTYQVVNIPEVISALKKLANDKDKTRVLQNIIARDMKPYLPYLARSAPKAKKTVTYHGDDSIEFKPGNLRRSMRIHKGKGATNTWVFMGPQVKNLEGSGYYSHFVQFGTKRGIKGKDYVKNVAGVINRQMSKGMGDKARKYLIGYAKRQGFAITGL